MNSGNESEYEPMSTETLEDISGGSKSHPSVNRREARYKIRDYIKQGQMEWKEELLSNKNMVKVLHKAFKAVVK